MGEWLKPAVLKTVCGATRTGVRIPLPPPAFLTACPSGTGPRRRFAAAFRETSPRGWATTDTSTEARSIRAVRTARSAGSPWMGHRVPRGIRARRVPVSSSPRTAAVDGQARKAVRARSPACFPVSGVSGSGRPRRMPTPPLIKSISPRVLHRMLPKYQPVRPPMRRIGANASSACKGTRMVCSLLRRSRPGFSCAHTLLLPGSRRTSGSPRRGESSLASARSMARAIPMGRMSKSSRRERILHHTRIADALDQAAAD